MSSIRINRSQRIVLGRSSGKSDGFRGLGSFLSSSGLTLAGPCPHFLGRKEAAEAGDTHREMNHSAQGEVSLGG